ncbi:amyloid beta A4 precursor protein-binding family A member 2-like [Scleropages formosus]|uniref:Amyloid beta A4 protein-binding family A member 2-like n=1 Tax=Scleropages formosus TaxID=113540 RepID=A0A0N8K390_SCLFO|nr:amyloid beta A4 precursor protein-binding family A member 2-like [Scleropages formosus]
MAYRERPGTSVGRAEPCARPQIVSDVGSQDQGTEGPQRPRDRSQSSDYKNSCSATPAATSPADVGTHGHTESADEDSAMPGTPEHAHVGCHAPNESADEDSSSDYVNNTSEEEDYDEGLPEDEEGVTYYIRYCPEDDTYLEGMDSSEGDYDGTSVEPPADASDCQEVVEEWAESQGECAVLECDPDTQRYDGRLEPVLDHQSLPMRNPTAPEKDERIEERAEREYCLSGGHGGEQEEERQEFACYNQEENGNSARGPAVRCGHQGGEEAEEDIDRIVAEIKMSMNVGSCQSYCSTEALAAAEPQPPPATHTPRSHEGRPKSLNIRPAHLSHPELQRGFAVQGCTAEERLQWVQEQLQVASGEEQPRKQQRSDLNRPLENNNAPQPTKKSTSFPSFVDVPGPCEPEDLIDGIIFAANYLGSTQLLSERNPSKNSPEGEGPTALTEVDLFISTQRIKVINADSQETMMDNALRTISYIADIGNIVVLMARRRMSHSASQDRVEPTHGPADRKKHYKMICHVFESEDAQLIAQSIGQAFSVAYQEFLRANGINPEDLSQKEYSDIINTQEMYNDDLIHFSNSENCKEVQLEKQKGEILGVVIVESGWGSILPTVILANMMNGAPAARSGKLSIGDQIMSVNNTSLVGLPLATCQGIIKGLKNQTQVKLNIVSCPPVTTVLIRRPDLKYQLGFSVQNGIVSLQGSIFAVDICSLMRGGIAERGGVRVGHRIIEINGQSAVATAHEKIVQALSNSVGEIHMKTMPAAMFRLLTGQETPMYI